MAKIIYKVKLAFSSKEEHNRILFTLKAQKLAFNEASKKHFGNKVNSIVILHREFYKKFRRENPNIPSQLVVIAERECLSHYKTVKSNKRKMSAPIEKRHFSIRLNQHLYSWKNGILKLTALGGKRVVPKLEMYPKVEELLSKFRFCDPLLFERNGQIWLAMTFDVPDSVITKPTAIGVDLGIRRVFATSDGKILKAESFNARKRRLRHLKSRLKSKGTKSARRHLRKLRRKEANINRNFLHLVANELLKTGANTLVLEDLKGIKKTKFRNDNKISQVSFYALRQILTYKAHLRGKQVITVKPHFSSQIDSRTGKKDGERKGCRYIGKDGVVLDADVNAACNLAKRSKLPFSCGNILDGQASVNRLNVYKSFIGNDKSITSYGVLIRSI